MKQRTLTLVGLLLITSMLGAQTIPFTTPPDEIDSVIGLLDAVVVAEQLILNEEALTAADLDAMEILIDRADVLGAEDLAARGRALLLLAQDESPQIEPQPALIEPLSPASENLFRRESRSFNAWIGSLSATGGMSLALAGIFYGLAERDFQRWLNEPDPAAAQELFQAWRGYEILSLTIGGVAVGALGIGIPLVYGLSAPEPTGLPTGQILFTAEEREQALENLYTERARLVTAINQLPELQPSRSLWSTVGLAVGALSGITSVTAFYLAGERWQRYLDAPFSEQGESLGTQVLVLDIVAITTAGLSLAGFGTALGIEILTEDERELEGQLREVNREIIRIRSSVEPAGEDG